MAIVYDKNKVASLYLTDDTHQAVKIWAEIVGVSIPNLCANLIEDMTPVLKELIQAYYDIQASEGNKAVLDKVMADNLAKARARLEVIDRETKR